MVANSSRTLVADNTIGLSGDRTAVLPNGGSGVLLQGGGQNRIGEPEAGNTIGGNGLEGRRRRNRPQRHHGKGATMPMTGNLPYCEPLVAREPSERQIPEPPRRGEPGGPPCGICSGRTTEAVWSDENWTLHSPVGGSLPGAV